MDGSAAVIGGEGTSRSLADLLQLVGDTTRRDEEDGGGVSPPRPASRDHVVELEDTAGGRPPPIVLAFSDLTYSVKNPAFFPRRRHRLGAASGESPAAAAGGAETKALLDSVSGEAREGEILAVLGASGSGKSTLIDALAGRIARGSLRGRMTLNGEDLGGRLLKIISAYVMQDDLLFPMLTVEETLTYSAEFRLPRALSRPRKAARVQTLIDQLGLRAAAQTIIGDEGHRGVSGGERRRVSIGIDIIHDPILLFLDEPTSGLDSTSAFIVVKVLKSIARSGSVVIMSVHQPSFRIVGLLDSLIFLSRGQTVYNGPPDMLPDFFAGFGRPIPENSNRCEFSLDLIRELEGTPGGARALADFNRSRQAAGARPPPDAGEGPGQLSLKDAISASITRGKLVSGATQGAAAAAPAEESKAVPTFANPFWTEVAVLSKRSFTNSRRMPELFGVRFGAATVTGIILATIFWRLDTSQKGVRERVGFFAFAMSTTFFTCADALPVFLQERFIFMRETAHNTYRRSSYVLANAAVAIPGLILLSAAFAAITFFAVGLAGGLRGFLFYFLVILASFWAGNSFVTFLSGVVPHTMMGFTVVVAILAYYLLFSGFFITRQRIPAYWLWFHYLSLVKYPYEAVLHNEFDDRSRCFVTGGQVFDDTPLGELPPEIKGRLLSAMSAVLMKNISGGSCVTTGPDILVQQGVVELGKWECLAITVAWGFFFRALFYVALLIGSRNKRK